MKENVGVEESTIVLLLQYSISTIFGNNNLLYAAASAQFTKTFGSANYYY